MEIAPLGLVVEKAHFTGRNLTGRNPKRGITFDNSYAPGPNGEGIASMLSSFGLSLECSLPPNVAVEACRQSL